MELIKCHYYLARWNEEDSDNELAIIKIQDSTWCYIMGSEEEELISHFEIIKHLNLDELASERG